MLDVNEVFETVQGEATHTGTPAVFIRLQGCPVGCGWCDTKHTWGREEIDIVEVDEMLEKEQDSPAFAELQEDSLVGLVTSQFKAKHIVLTGGEPCINDLTRLTSLLIEKGYTVQIETSGTHEIKCHPDTFVTVSPKIGMPGGLEVRNDAYTRANEIKYPVGKMDDVENLINEVLPHTKPSQSIWLQPLSQNKKATALCIEQATENGWRVSIQTHKFIGVR